MPSLASICLHVHPPSCPHGGVGWWEDVVQPLLSLSPSNVEKNQRVILSNEALIE